jgi:acyl-CoA thioesterase-2
VRETVKDLISLLMDSPSAQAARGLARGQIVDRAGRLAASVAQEGLSRDLKLPATGSEGGP